MSSSYELTKRILSRLGVEEAEEDSPKETTCPFNCSSKFSMLDKLNEDVDRLDSNTMTLGTELWKIEARGCSHYHNLRSDHQQVKGEVHHIKEMVRTHGERLDEMDRKLNTLYAMHSLVNENKEKIAELEEHAKALNAQLDEEKRQRKKSDSNLSGLLVIGFLAFLWLLNRQSLAETQVAPLLTPPALEAELAARAYIESKT